MVQAIFLDGSVKPYVGLGYSYSRVWFKESVPVHTDEINQNMDISLSLRNHFVFLELGANFEVNPRFSFEAFAGYSYSLFPNVGLSFDFLESSGVKISNVDVTADLIDYFHKAHVGGRFYYSVIDGLDLGLSLKGFYGWLKPKEIVDSQARTSASAEEKKVYNAIFDKRSFKGFQIALSIRKRFDLIK